MQTLEGLHLLRDSRVAKDAGDGRVDVAVFVLVLTNEHEHGHLVVQMNVFHRRYSTNYSRWRLVLAETRRQYRPACVDTLAKLTSVESQEVPWLCGAVAN